MLRVILVMALLAVLGGLAGGEGEPAVRFALALHGGAGVIPADTPKEEVEAHERGLKAALEAGRRVLVAKGTALDAVEATVRVLEDDPLYNAGRGAVMNSQGGFELDASIMDGSNLHCGAVAGVKHVKNPIVAARLVMEKTPHVLLMGSGADEFAESMGLAPVDQQYFWTEKRFLQWKQAQAKNRVQLDHSKGTVGAVALDMHGNLAAATSTGGMTNKRYGRCGDSPIVGAGTYANNKTCAVSCTGTGEEFIRNAAAFQVSALMEYRGDSLERAVKTVVHEKLKTDDGGMIAVDRQGNIVMDYSTAGMFRASLDSTGRTVVKIWE